MEVCRDHHRDQYKDQCIQAACIQVVCTQVVCTQDQYKLVANTQGEYTQAVNTRAVYKLADHKDPNNSMHRK